MERPEEREREPDEPVDDEPSTDQLDEEPDYSGDAPGGNLKGG